SCLIPECTFLREGFFSAPSFGSQVFVIFLLSSSVLHSVFPDIYPQMHQTARQGRGFWALLSLPGPLFPEHLQALSRVIGLLWFLITGLRHQFWQGYAGLQAVFLCGLMLPDGCGLLVQRRYRLLLTG